MFSYSKKILTAQLDKELGFIIDEVQKLNLPKNFYQYAIYVFSELFTNVTEHAFAKNVKCEAIIEKGKLKMTLMDDGIGLKQSYANKNIIAKNDQSAIELVLSGLSTKDFRERGFGLFSIRRLTSALDGKLSISSGNVTAEIKKNSIVFKEFKKSKKGVEIKIESKIKPIDFYKYIE